MTSDDNERRAREQAALQQREKIEQVAVAVREGKLPTTQQMTTAIEQVEQSDIIHDAARGMTPTGKKVLADTEKLLETTKEVLTEKNPNDELQYALYHGMQALKHVEGSVDSAKLKSQSQEGAEAAGPLLQEGVSKLVDLAMLLVSSSEFRRLVNELSQIAQDAIRSTVVTKSDQGIPRRRRPPPARKTIRQPPARKRRRQPPARRRRKQTPARRKRKQTPARRRRKWTPARILERTRANQHQTKRFQRQRKTPPWPRATSPSPPLGLPSLRPLHP